MAILIAIRPDEYEHLEENVSELNQFVALLCLYHIYGEIE